MIANEMMMIKLNKYSLIIFVVTLTFINPSVVKAQSSNTGTQTQGTNNGGSAFNAGSIDAAMNSSSSANTASGGQGSGALMNFAGSGIMAGIGAAFQAAENQPMANMFYLQAALAAVQAGMQMGTSGGNKGASKQFLTNPTFPSPELGGGPQGPGGDIGAGTDTKDAGPKGFNNSSPSDIKPPPSIQSVLDKMNANGYKVDLNNGTFTTPDGKSISLKDASNGSKVEAKLGLPAGTYAKGMEMVNEVYKKNGFGEGNFIADAVGGGGINSMGDNQTEGYDGSGGKGNRKDANATGGGRAPASALVAGLTTKYNGENIGVAADDIFSMVSRRYNLKTLQDSFITADRPAKGMLGETAFMNPKK